MFSVEEYLSGWSFYLLSSIVLLIVFWRITQGITSQFYMRQLLRLSIAVLLLTPYPVVDGSSDYLAPAWSIAGLDIVFSGVNGFWRAGGPLLVIWGITVLLYCFAIGVCKVLNKSEPVNNV